MTTAEPTRAKDGPSAASVSVRIPAQATGDEGRPDGSVRSRIRRHPVLLTAAVAGVAHLLWFFFFANSGGDIAAQDAWAEFVGRHPGTAYNLAWYGGMHPVSYSVVSPYLMSVLGVRTTMMIAGTVSSALTALILVLSLIHI